MIKNNNVRWVVLGKHAVCGYDDGKIKLWDLRTAKIKHNFTGKTLTVYNECKAYQAVLEK